MPQVAVKIKVSNGRLQLVFSYQGKRHYLSLGYPDSPTNRRLAQLKAAEIERDILLERFEGIDKYKQVGGSKEASSVETQVKPRVTLPELWAQYAEYKRSIVAPSTWDSQYRMWQRFLDRCPHGIESPAKVRDWALREFDRESARRWIIALNACCKWSVVNGLISANPFEGITIAKPKNKSDHDVDAFTAAERDLIIATFENSQHYSHYAPFVKFLFFTGCRPSEAVALEWDSISRDWKTLTFKQAATLNAEGQIRIKPGLKTQAKRIIPINDRLKTLLERQPRTQSLIFPAPRGGLIDFQNFAARGWRKVLEQAKLPYKNPYQTRHTFITLALASGTSVKDIARLVGNSPEIIHRHYASGSRDLELPEV